MIPLYMPDAVVGADVDRRRLVLPGSKEWDLPSIRAGLTLAMPLTKSTAPVHSAAGSMGLSTETVSALGTRARETDDYIVQAIANQARFTKYGMVSEVARENLCLRSQELDVNGSGTPWNRARASVSANTAATTDPYGTNLADKIVEDSTATNTHCIYQTITFTAAAHTFSGFFKAAERTVVCLRMHVSSEVYKRAYFDLSAGTVGTTSAAGTTARIRDWGNGWYRCEITATPEVSIREVMILLADADPESDADPSYSGNGSNGTYAFGTQVELGSAASTYTPTEASSVVRAKEDLDIAGGNASIAAGTLMTAVTLDGLHGVNQYICDIYVDATNHISLYVDTAGKPALLVDAGGEQALLTATSALTVGTTAVITAAWAANDVRLYVNGADEQADTSATMPSGSPTVFIGQDGGNATQLMGSGSHMTIWDNAMTAADILANAQWAMSKVGLL